MNRFPSVSEYALSLSRPRELFRSIEIDEVCRDSYGEIELRSGNSAAVFRIRVAGSGPGFMGLRCFRKYNPHLPAVYEYFSGCDSPLIAKCRYCKDEMCVASASDSRFRYYDVVLSDWVEGSTLESHIRSAAARRDTRKLSHLASIFDDLCCQLLRLPWAHGDLKPENIVLTPGGRAVLIDYDAAYVPDSGFETTPEIGTPAYQHPLRNSDMYDKHIDDYPMVLISANLHLLSVCPELYRADGDDILVLRSGDIFSGRRSVLNGAMELFARMGDARTYECCRRLSSPVPCLDNMDELFAGPPLKHLWRDSELFPFERCGRWGFRNMAGDTVVAPLWDEAFDFSDGVAAVRLADKYHYIDCSGKTVINGSEWECVKSFSEGYAAVKKDGHWGYIDHGGKMAVPAVYDKARRVKGGRAEVFAGSVPHIIEFF